MTQNNSITENSESCVFGLHKLWILNRQSGICLFEQTFEKGHREMDPDLIGGFLMAISKFSEEMIGEDIRIIETQSMQILYQNTEKLVVVSLFLNGINKPIAESLLKDISNLFIEKYASYLATDQLANVNLFRDFVAEIEDRYGTKTICFNYARRFLKRGQKPTNVYDSLKGVLERHRKGVMSIICNVNP